MSSGPQLAMLWFRVGETPCAILAEAVLGINAVVAEAIELSSLLNGQAVHTTPREAVDEPEQWALSIASGEQDVALLVNGPCHFGELHQSDALDYPATVSRAHYKWLLGFALREGALAFVLSASALVEKAIETRGDASAAPESERE